MQADFASGYEFEMFDRIGDVDLVAVDAGFLQGTVEHLSCRPHERFSGKVFLVAGLLADQHGLCMGRPSPNTVWVAFFQSGQAWQSAASSRRVLRLVPTFQSSCPIAALTFHELRKVIGTNKSIIPVPLIDLKSLGRTPRLWCRDFRSAVLGAGTVAMSRLVLREIKSEAVVQSGKGYRVPLIPLELFTKNLPSIPIDSFADVSFKLEHIMNK
jgi:hypothetical protein